MDGLGGDRLGQKKHYFWDGALFSTLFSHQLKLGHTEWVTTLVTDFQPPQLTVMKVEVAGDILLLWKIKELKQEQDLKDHKLKV